MKFSREPVALIQGLVIPVLMALVLLPGWSEEQTGVVNAALLAIGGVVAAFGVSVDAVLPLLSGLAKAVLAVLLAFGTPISEPVQTAILTVVSIVVAYLTRSQVTAKVPAPVA